jgi:BlaI family penicillinase repressor
MQHLSLREEQVLTTLWKWPQGATIGEARSQMVTPFPYTTIASILHQLVRKGYAEGQKVANRQYFKACLSQQDYGRQLLYRLVADHFQHSYVAVVAFCVQEGHVRATDLLQLLPLLSAELPFPLPV